MRRVLILSSLLLCAAIPAHSQVSVGINIGVNMPVYPQLVVVPGYPVYYDPDVDSNYFFYDGQYWVYAEDNWYASDWYNGPWDLIEPDFVPVYVLRVPVQYYRRPPVYFRAWQRDAPPRWGEHWGNDWERRRGGWDHWDRNVRPPPAPLPVYQRQFSGDRYPHAIEQQRSLHTQNYHYQPRDPLVKQHVDNAAHDRGDPRVNNPPAKAPAAPQPARDVRHDVRDRSPNPVQPTPPRPIAPNNSPDRNAIDRNMHRNDGEQHANPPRPVQAPPNRDTVVAPRPQSPPPVRQQPPAANVERNINRDVERRENVAPAPRSNPAPQHEQRPPQQPHEPPREHREEGR